MSRTDVRRRAPLVLDALRQARSLRAVAVGLGLEQLARRLGDLLALYSSPSRVDFANDAREQLLAGAEHVRQWLGAPPLSVSTGRTSLLSALGVSQGKTGVAHLGARLLLP